MFSARGVSSDLSIAGFVFSARGVSTDLIIAGRSQLSGMPALMTEPVYMLMVGENDEVGYCGFASLP
jgi:hypothetical protein